jgi:uncharacterized delta-60 repeat protein
LLELQPDGKAVVGGFYCSMGGSTGADFCLARYQTNGALDPSFGTGGVVTTTMVGPSTDNAEALALAPDGHIYLAGLCASGAGPLCMAAYNADGSLDTNFGTGGKLDYAGFAGATGRSWRTLAVQPDGKLLAAGYCTYPGTGGDFCVARLLSNGTADPTFGTAGETVTVISATGTDLPNAILARPDGSFYVTGQCVTSAPEYDFCAARYTANGALDTSFDSDGIATYSIGTGTTDRPAAGAIQADGDVLMGGYCDGGATNNDMCAIRFLPSGALDTSFDGDGKLIVPNPSNDDLRSVLVQQDGRIVLVGACQVAGNGTDMCLVRINEDGSLDTSFDADGRLTKAISAGTGSDYGYDSAEGIDGRLVVVGDCTPGGGTGTDFCVSRFASGGSFQQYANGSADWDTAATTSMFGACLRSVASATAAWTVNPTCPTTDGAYWNAVPASAAPLATAATGVTNATANVRFGLRPAVDQLAGRYVAPVTFTVTAP